MTFDEQMCQMKAVVEQLHMIYQHPASEWDAIWWKMALAENLDRLRKLWLPGVWVVTTGDDEDIPSQLLGAFTTEDQAARFRAAYEKPRLGFAWGGRDPMDPEKKTPWPANPPVRCELNPAYEPVEGQEL